MSYTWFVLGTGSALLAGVAIGLERQYNQHPAGLRTNVLVSVGAALFVSLSQLVGDVNSPTPIASYVVSGIGFLGGGVILREGFTVKGLNTAATLWCSAAVGVLCGSGFPIHAATGTAFVLVVNLGLRPLARRIDSLRKADDLETIYRLRVICAERDEAVVRSIVLRHVNGNAGMTVRSVSSQDDLEGGGSIVVAEVLTTGLKDRLISEVMSRLNIEPGVKSVKWEKALNAEVHA